MIFTVTDFIQLGHTFFIFKILRYFPEKNKVLGRNKDRNKGSKFFWSVTIQHTVFDLIGTYINLFSTTSAKRSSSG